MIVSGVAFQGRTVSLRVSKRAQLNPPKYFLVDERNLPEQTRREKLIAPKNTNLANLSNALLWGKKPQKLRYICIAPSPQKRLIQYNPGGRFDPVEKYDRQIGSFPHGSEWKMNNVLMKPPPSNVSNLWSFFLKQSSPNSTQTIRGTPWTSHNQSCSCPILTC